VGQRRLAAGPDAVPVEWLLIHTVAGRVRVRLPRLAPQHEDRIIELQIGQLLALDRGIAYAIEAVANSAIVLTLGWSGDDEPRNAA